MVPRCPEWTVTDLVHHLGWLYGWVTRSLLERGGTERPEPRAPPEDLPDRRRPLAWWHDALRARCSPLLEALDPETPAWNWAPQAKKAGVLAPADGARDRRAPVGHADGVLAVAEPIEAKLAADGVSEVLDTWLPAGRRQNGDRPHGVVQLVATDAGQEWFVRLRGEGVALLDTDTILDTDEPPARVHAAGTASDLLLALYGRVGFDTLVVSGDATLLTRYAPGDF